MTWENFLNRSVNILYRFSVRPCSSFLLLGAKCEVWSEVSEGWFTSGVLVTTPRVVTISLLYGTFYFLQDGMEVRSCGDCKDNTAESK